VPQRAGILEERGKTVRRGARPARGAEFEDLFVEREPERLEDEERRSARGGVESVDEGTAPRRVVGDRAEREDETPHLRGRERREGEHRQCLGDRRALGARRGEAEHRRAGEAPEEALEHAVRREVDPVHVIDDERERPFVRHRLHEVAERLDAAAVRLVGDGGVGRGREP